ncbi:hypothetical protein M0R45_018787 [Rubus argutus]|uniref:Uncharacterized protein n=1 Tax=Rubus argutus TaxID=59490 RepID=A0AAW1X657_RUBAR
MACITTNAIARSSFVAPLDHHHHHERTVGEAAWSKFKSTGHRFLDYFFHSKSKNITTTGDGDNKRVVPTGPNPLHNR